MTVFNTGKFNDAIPVPEKVDKCPRCENPNLGQIVTLLLEYCPRCNTWLRYAKGEPRRKND